MAIKKRNLLEENIAKNDLKFWDIDTYVLLELPQNNKHYGLYTPDGAYIVGTTMVSTDIISSKLPFKNKQVIDWKQRMGKLCIFS